MALVATFAGWSAVRENQAKAIFGAMRFVAGEAEHAIGTGVNRLARCIAGGAAVDETHTR